MSDELFHDAKEFANKNQTTMHALVEEGLRCVLNDAQTKAKPAFILEDKSVHGGTMLISDSRLWPEMGESPNPLV